MNVTIAAEGCFPRRLRITYELVGLEYDRTIGLMKALTFVNYYCPGIISPRTISLDDKRKSYIIAKVPNENCLGELAKAVKS